MGEQRYADIVKLLRITVPDLMARYGIQERSALRWYYGHKPFPAPIKKELDALMDMNSVNNDLFISLAEKKDFRAIRDTFGFEPQDLARMFHGTKNMARAFIKGRKEPMDYHVDSVVEWLHNTVGDHNDHD